MQKMWEGGSVDKERGYQGCQGSHGGRNECLSGLFEGSEEDEKSKRQGYASTTLRIRDEPLPEIEKPPQITSGERRVDSLRRDVSQKEGHLLKDGEAQRSRAVDGYGCFENSRSRREESAGLLSIHG